MFIEKKLIAACFSPVSLCLMLLAVALLFLWINRARKTQLFLFTLSFVLLFCISSNTLSNYFLEQLENRYPPMGEPSQVSAIVVLGGGVRNKVSAPPNTQLGAASLVRLVEGVRLYHALQNEGVHVKFILSGGRVFGSPSESGMMQNTAVVLGVDPKDMQLESGSQDTYHEALYLKPILGNKPFLLVTSASHMPRAVALFRAQGLNPIPAPTQFLARKNQFSLARYFPNAGAIMNTDIILHEYIGMTWSYLMGRI